MTTNNKEKTHEPKTSISLTKISKQYREQILLVLSRYNKPMSILEIHQQVKKIETINPNINQTEHQIKNLIHFKKVRKFGTKGGLIYYCISSQIECLKNLTKIKKDFSEIDFSQKLFDLMKKNDDSYLGPTIWAELYYNEHNFMPSKSHIQNVLNKLVRDKKIFRYSNKKGKRIFIYSINPKPDFRICIDHTMYL